MRSSLLTAGLVTTIAAGVLVWVPGAAAKEPTPPADVTVFIQRTYRQVIDVGVAGASTGDITTSAGKIRRTLSGRAIGHYLTSQITVRVNRPGGRETRNTMIQFDVPGGTILTQAMVDAPVGTPPRGQFTHAITGGTGAYSGARGTLYFTAIDATRYRITFDFV
jgi:hypothetical protein